MPTIIGTTGSDDLLGTDLDDIIDGQGGGDTINGRGGHDVITGSGTIFGGEGDDRIIVLSPGSSVLDGGNGQDTLDLTRYSAVALSPYRFIASAEAPNAITSPTISWQTGKFEFTGVGFTATNFEIIQGVTRVQASYSPDYGVIYDFTLRTVPIEIRGGDSSDVITGGSAADVLRGGGGDDTIVAGPGDQVFGEGGNDTVSAIITASSGPAILNGGDGQDTLNLTTALLSPSMSLAAYRIGSTEVSGFETTNITLADDFVATAGTITVVGTDGGDTVSINRGTSAAGRNQTFVVHAGGGDDTITVSGATVFGGAGADTIRGSGTLYGEAGNDIISGSGVLDGGDGDDILIGYGSLNGGAGDDRFGGFEASVIAFGPGLRPAWALRNSEVSGGTGSDTIVVQSIPTILNQNNSVTVSLVSGTLTGGQISEGYGLIRLTSIENVITSDGNDTITGNDLANRLEAGSGNDTVLGGGGDDLIFGGAGDDTLSGEGGNDIVWGGDGADTLDGGSGDDVLFGEGGNDRLNGGSGNDVMHVGAGDNFVDGGVDFDSVVFAYSIEGASFSYEDGAIIVSGPSGRNVLRNVERLDFSDAIVSVGLDGRVVLVPFNDVVGTAASDRLVGTAGRDYILGQGGDDILIGGGNFDRLDGGEGIDAAAYSGLVRAYSVARSGGGFSSVSGGPEEGTDTLISIERLSFLDGALDRDPNGLAAQVYRLYDAALDRGPDQAGLSGWVGRLASGTTLAQAAQAFATAPEFVARYGNLSNEDFVKTMYRFSLNREGDAFGISQWKAQLDAGGSRGSILQSFSESVEHRNLTAAAVSTGLFVQDDRTIAVARLYDAAFDRVPDQGGLAYWRGTLDAGGSLFAIANAFVSSQEFQDRYGALSNTQFIDQLYRFTLNREADDFGRQVWVDRLNGGTTRAEMVVIFSESIEHTNLTAPTWLGGVRYENYVEPSSSIADAHSIKDMDAFVIPAQLHDTAYDAGLFDSALDTSLADMMHSPMIDHRIVVDMSANPLDLATLPSGDDLNVGLRHSDWM